MAAAVAVAVAAIIVIVVVVVVAAVAVVGGGGGGGWWRRGVVAAGVVAGWGWGAVGVGGGGGGGGGGIAAAVAALVVLSVAAVLVPKTWSSDTSRSNPRHRPRHYNKVIVDVMLVQSLHRLIELTPWILSVEKVKVTLRKKNEASPEVTKFPYRDHWNLTPQQQSVLQRKQL